MLPLALDGLLAALLVLSLGLGFKLHSALRRGATTIAISTGWSGRSMPRRSARAQRWKL
jgi:hypothetical protein